MEELQKEKAFHLSAMAPQYGALLLAYGWILHLRQGMKWWEALFEALTGVLMEAFSGKHHEAIKVSTSLIGKSSTSGWLCATVGASCGGRGCGTPVMWFRARQCPAGLGKKRGGVLWLCCVFHPSEIHQSTFRSFTQFLHLKACF